MNFSRLLEHGTLVGSDTSFGFTFDNTKPVKFGGVNSTILLDRWLNGSLADIAVFDAALPAAHVSVTVLEPIDRWRQTHFGTTDTTGPAAADADHIGEPAFDLPRGHVDDRDLAPAEREELRGLVRWRTG
jgi:hypothetical protein